MAGDERSPAAVTGGQAPAGRRDPATSTSGLPGGPAAGARTSMDPVTWVIALAAFMAYDTLAVFKYLRLDPGSWDLGIYTEYVKQLAGLHAPVVSIRGAGHASPRFPPARRCLPAGHGRRRPFVSRHPRLPVQVRLGLRAVIAFQLFQSLLAGWMVLAITACGGGTASGCQDSGTASGEISARVSDTAMALLHGTRAEPACRARCCQPSCGCSWCPSV